MGSTGEKRDMPSALAADRSESRLDATRAVRRAEERHDFTQGPQDPALGAAGPGHTLAAARASAQQPGSTQGQAQPWRADGALQAPAVPLASPSPSAPQPSAPCSTLIQDTNRDASSAPAPEVPSGGPSGQPLGSSPHAGSAASPASYGNAPSGQNSALGHAPARSEQPHGALRTFQAHPARIDAIRAESTQPFPTTALTSGSGSSSLESNRAPEVAPESHAFSPASPSSPLSATGGHDLPRAGTPSGGPLRPSPTPSAAVGDVTTLSPTRGPERAADEHTFHIADASSDGEGPSTPAGAGSDTHRHATERRGHGVPAAVTGTTLHRAEDGTELRAAPDEAAGKAHAGAPEEPGAMPHRDPSAREIAPEEGGEAADAPMQTSLVTEGDRREAGERTYASSRSDGSGLRVSCDEAPHSWANSDEGAAVLNDASVAIEHSTLGTRILDLGQSAHTQAIKHGKAALKRVAVDTVLGASGFMASGGVEGDELGDSAARGGVNAVRSLHRSRKAGRGRTATAWSAFVAASDSEEIRDIDKGVSTARATKKGIMGARSAVQKLHGTDVVSSESGRRVMKARAQRMSREIFSRKAAGEVVRGHGLGIRVTTTLRSLATTVSSAVSSGFSALLGSLSAPLTIALLLIAPLLIITALLGSLSQDVEGLGPYSSQMVQYLRDYGWDDTHIAAAVGNAIYESGGDQAALEIDPAHEGDLSGVVNYEYEKNCGIYSWTDTAPGVGVMTQLKEFAAAQGKEWQDLTCQLDFFTQRYLAARAYATSRWLDIDDLHEATKVMVAPTGGILAGAQLAVESPAIDARYDLADRVYAAITSGGAGGEEYEASEEVQKRIADAAYAQPATAPGFCAAWVTNVYRAAGLTPPTGNADDMWRSYTWSTDRSELKVGMLIASPSTTGSTQYGHVGIYVGDGIVLSSSEGRVRHDTLDQWMTIFRCVDGVNTIRWGFPPGVEL